ncbi:MAG TPA: hypothetical protein H9761_01165 [Candidatus Eisenbergiella merdavium]|uniref:Uncharacterized protein n=1 Tax=Candidatus Eisenbergiella merdavium TaxID=2838551 RepID=A0A9D2NCK8_9FIRM|nr:hypothetical protein [Candidatus Eisenbergiella merdavium]
MVIEENKKGLRIRMPAGARAFVFSFGSGGPFFSRIVFHIPLVSGKIEKTKRRIAECGPDRSVHLTFPQNRREL